MAQQLDREARRSRALAGEDLVRRCRAGLLKDHAMSQICWRSRATSLRTTLCVPPPDQRIPTNGEPPYRNTQALNGRFSIR